MKYEILEGIWGPNDTIEYDSSVKKFKINFYIKQKNLTNYMYLIQDAQTKTIFKEGSGEGANTIPLQFDIPKQTTTKSYIFHILVRDPETNRAIKTRVKFYTP